MHAEFEKEHVSVIAIARDTAKKLLVFKQKYNLLIPIYPDRKGTVVKNYNVFKFMKLTDSFYGKFRLAIPSTYLVNKNGKIVWTYIGSRDDRPNSTLLLKVIQENLPTS